MLMSMDYALGIGFHASRCRLSLNLLSSNGAASSSWRGGGGVKFPGGRWQFNMDCCSTVPAGKSLRRRTCACAPPEHSESLPDPSKSRWMQKYHPSEEIREPLSVEDGNGARLTDAETARTLIEVNSKAALMFTEDMGEVQQNVIWPDVPYLTDEHGDIYIEVTTDDNIMKNFISEDTDETMVQVIIGLDKVEILTEIEAAGPSVFNYGFDEVSSEDDDLDYESEEDDVIIFEDAEEDDVASEMANDWSHAETMQATHPVYFARKIAEVVSNINLDWMDQPSASLVIQGLLRPAFVEEHKFNKKYPYIGDAGSNGGQHLGKHIKDNIEGEMDNDQSLQGRMTFFKLQIINIQLVSACGNQSTVKVQDYHQACPDVIAHSAANILSRLKAGGEKTTQALKSLCWRHKSIHVEEASVIGLDSLGFDLRVCSGTQIQTLRFAFNTRVLHRLGGLAGFDHNAYLAILISDSSCQVQERHQSLVQRNRSMIFYFQGFSKNNSGKQAAFDIINFEA